MTSHCCYTISTLIKAAVALTVGPSTLVWAQAHIVETQETAFYYVNGASGSDSNPGTQLQPFKTLSKGVTAAVAESRQGVGARVIVLPGTYRESITVGGAITSPVTVEAQTSGTVIVSGADVWTGWQTYSSNSNIYMHSWPYAWGYCAQLAGPAEQNIVRRREMIFVNGFHLTQVLAMWEMLPGTFYVNETGQTAYIWPPAGTNMNTATVEVATRPTLLTIQSLQSWVIRGITFQYGNGCRQINPAVVLGANASNILFDTDSFLWNNASGISVGNVTDVTVQNSFAKHNGESGFLAQNVKNTYWSSNEGSYNNWRGAQGAYYGWQAAGGKFMGIHNSNWESFTALFNLGKGIHFDTDNLSVGVDGLMSANNLRSGVQLESSEGPVTFSNSQVCGSNGQAGQRFDGGINLVDSSYVTITGSTLYNNGTAQILYNGQPGGMPVANWETGITTQVYNSYLTATSNTIEAVGSQQAFQDGYLTTDWSKVASTLSSDYNTWWNSSESSAFTVPVPSGYTSQNFSQWKTLTAQDSNSSFAAPSVNPSTTCNVTPDAADYWLIVNSGSNTVTHGSATSYQVTAVPLGVSGTVSVSADWHGISGVTASWSTNSIPLPGSATFTVSTSSSTPPGTYTVTMLANLGSITRTVAAFLTVQ